MPDDQFSFLTPEMAQRLADASFAPEQQEQLAKQIEQARALRAHDTTQYMTPGAAALGGIGHLANVFSSVRDENGLKAQRDQLLATQKSTGADFLRYEQAQRERADRLQQAYIDALRGKGPQQANGPGLGALMSGQGADDGGSLGSLMYGQGDGQ